MSIPLSSNVFLVCGPLALTNYNLSQSIKSSFFLWQHSEVINGCWDGYHLLNQNNLEKITKED